eukprot:COSAG05_NODE_17335_length_327_cov_0.714912_1_plen_53_part_10
MAIVVTPAATAYFTPKVSDRVEAKRNTMRNMVLSKHFFKQKTAYVMESRDWSS